LDEDCPAPHTSCIVTACIMGSHHCNYVTHRSQCAQFNKELLQALLGCHSKVPPAQPPTKVQLEHKEVALHQSMAPSPYTQSLPAAKSPEGGRGQSRRGRLGRGRGMAPLTNAPGEVLMLNTNLQCSLTPGVSLRDGYPRTWPHINFVTRENNIPIYQAREWFVTFDIASLYEAWKMPIPPIPHMPDLCEDHSRPYQPSAYPTIHHLVATTTPRRLPVVSTLTAGSSMCMPTP
jgi:hypothetical protein